MKKGISKLLATLLSLSMLPVAGLAVNAAAGTSANLVKIVEFTGQEETATVPAVTSATAKVSEMVLPGRTADDKGIEIDITAGKTTAYADFDVTVDAEKGGAPSSRTVVFDIYPNDTITSIQFKGRANCTVNKELTMSNVIPVSALKAGQWNKVMFIYNPDGYHSVYINNVLYENTAYNTHFGTIAKNSWRKANIRLYAYTEATEGAYLLLDNIQTAQGTAVTPTIKSGKYIIDSQIHEYGAGATVADLLNNITYNGTEVAVKNALGEDITENTEAEITKGDSVYVYDSSIGTGLYYIGDAHKALAALNDASGTIMAGGFDDDSTNNFAGGDSTVAVVSGTAYKKSDGDKVLCVTGGADKAVYYIQRTTNVADRTKISTLSFEVYPNGTWGSLDISTRGGLYFVRIPSERLKQNEWNQITVYMGGDDKTSRPNTLYINGKQVAGETTSASDSDKIYIHDSLLVGGSNATAAYQQLRIGVAEANTEGSQLVIDNFYQAEGVALVPSLKSKSYILDGMSINEFRQNTVEDVLSDITYSGSKAVIKNSEGADITEDLDAVITSGSSLYIYDGEFITGHYTFKDAHKALVALSDASGTVMAGGFDDDSANNFAGLDSTLSVISGAGYGKPDTDKVLCVAGNAEKVSYSAYRSTNVADRTKISTLSFEVYPNGTWGSLDISTRGGLYFVRIPSERLKQNEWNQITVYMGGDDKTSRPNTLYVNGKQVAGETTNASDSNKIYIHDSLLVGGNNTTAAYQQLRIGVAEASTEGSQLVIDNFYQAEGVALVPSLTTDSYILDGMSINEFLDDTVEDVLSDITYNGSKAVIKNSDGADITEDLDAVITGGSRLYIYDGEFVTGHYTFKTAHTAPAIINSYIDNFDGITATNGTCGTETGVNGKADSDTSLKLTADTLTANATTNSGTVYFASDVLDAANKTIPATAVSFEVYPNDTIDEIIVAGRASSPSYEVRLGAIPVSALKADQWNRILFVYNKSGENKLYLNGELYSSEDSGHFASTVTSGVFRIKANYTKQEGVTPYVYMDEIQTAHIITVNPEIKTTAYGVDGNLISGCTDTAANVKANIKTSYGVNLVIKNSAGEVIADEAQVLPESSIYVYDGNMIIGHYYTEAGKLIVNTPVITHSGTNKGDTVDASVTYADTTGTPQNFNIYVAAYSEDGRLIGVTVKRITTTGYDGEKTVAADTLTLTETAKEIKVIVMDDECEPLCSYGYV